MHPVFDAERSEIILEQFTKTLLRDFNIAQYAGESSLLNISPAVSRNHRASAVRMRKYKMRSPPFGVLDKTALLQHPNKL